MLKQNLSQKLLQKLSPQQIQLMKLIQLPTSSIEQRIEEELESNPALEESDDYSEVFDLDDQNDEISNEPESNEEVFELDDYLNEYIEEDPISYKINSEYNTEAQEDFMPQHSGSTFSDSLNDQLGLLDLTEEEFIVATQIIGSLDNDGYLRRSGTDIVDDLLFAQNIEVQERTVTNMIAVIQDFDPAGLAAADLQECLLIQIIKRLENADDPNRKSKLIAQKILTNHFDEFSKKHYTKLEKNLFISRSELKDAIDEILKLNPRPASAFNSSKQGQVKYVVPDYFILNRGGELELILNNKNAPDLHINDHYLNVLKSYKENKNSTKDDKKAVLFIKQKIDSAKWFIDAIVQRQQTLYKSMYAIMQYQYDYFLTGDERKMKPMILKDISDITGLDISTVSRVASVKFVQTEFGTKRLKEFFSESIQKEDGEEVSTLEVKNILQEIVSGENKRKPFSDEKLKSKLMDRGYNIARRTVAKYREQLQIPVARLRKEI
jgi:RNA polymerase sigma-54 factor